MPFTPVVISPPTPGGSRGRWGYENNANVQALADGINQLPEVLTEEVDTQLDSRGIIPRIDMVTRLKEGSRPILLGHRGAGQIHGEHTLEGYRDTARSGFMIEVDVRMLATGELVACHDATTERTMTGPVTNVADMTYEDWKSRKVLSPWRGGKQNEPATWEEILAEFGGRTPIMAEFKDTSTTAVQALIDSVTERGLHRWVILNSFTLSLAQQAAAAGVAARYLVGSTTAVSPATLVSSGIEFLGPSKNMDPATVQTFKDAGIYTIAYGWKTPDQWEDLQGVFDGAGFDDPWLMTRRYDHQNRDPFNTGIPFKGWSQYEPAGSASPHLPFNYEGPTGTLFMDGSMLEDSVTRSCRQSWATPSAFVAGNPVRLRFKVQFDRPQTAPDRWMGAFVGVTPNEAPYEDGTVAGQEGYHLLVRRNGTLAIYRVDGTGGATLVGSTTGTALETFREYEIEVIVTISSVYLRNQTLGGQLASASDATYRPSEGFGLHFTVNGTTAMVRDVFFGQQVAETMGY